MDFLITCKPDFEKILAREVALSKGSEQVHGAGWLLVRCSDGLAFNGLCFGQYILYDPVSVKATSVNSFAVKLIDLFLSHLGDRRVSDPWGY